MSKANQMDKLISLYDALEQNIERLRKPIWANTFDHVKIDIIKGKLGMWMHLYAPFNQECNGRDPVDMLIMADNDPREQEWLPYIGFLPDSEEYKAEVARFERQSPSMKPSIRSA